MKQKIKPILTILLLAFAGIALVVQITKEFRSVEPMRLAEGLNVVCTHATARCPTCTTMERLTKETLHESFKDDVTAGKIVFREINYEQPEVASLAEKFKVATASVVLVNVKNGEIITGKNLADEAWKLYTDEPAFKNMLKEQIDAMFQGKTLDTDNESQEIIFVDNASHALDQEKKEQEDNRPPYYLADAELDKKLGVDEKTETPKEYVQVIYFHRVPGCDACQLMSKYVYETVKRLFADDVKEKRIVLRYRNFEEEKNADLVEKLGIKSPSLAVIQIEDGEMVKAKLAGKIWSLVAEKEKFIRYVAEEMKSYLPEPEEE